ncbi:creatininase family protein [Candidatus Bathyarchaeota archaeon]|nr:creatininase family protein [Candidatus Bathyarchaeota archaeon]
MEEPATQLGYGSTYKEVEESGVKGALLPIGSLEQHGPHLPLCTDTVIAFELAKAVASRLNLFLLPPIPISCSAEHRGVKGTVYLRPETLTLVLRDIVESLSRSGFKYLVVLSGHGGNWVLKPAVRYLNLDYPEFKVILVGESVYGNHLREIFEEVDDLHAGEHETSLMLYLKPNMVRDKPEGCRPEAGREMLDYLPIWEITPTGIWGNPSRASVEKGRLAFEKTVEAIVKYLKTLLARLNLL